MLKISANKFNLQKYYFCLSLFRMYINPLFIVLSFKIPAINTFSMHTSTRSTPQPLKVRNNAIHGAYIFINILFHCLFCVLELIFSFILKVYIKAAGYLFNFLEGVVKRLNRSLQFFREAYYLKSSRVGFIIYLVIFVLIL